MAYYKIYVIDRVYRGFGAKWGFYEVETLIDEVIASNSKDAENLWRSMYPEFGVTLKARKI